MLQRAVYYVKTMGPAWIIGAVACGPATLASVSTAGARYGYRMLRVVLLSAVFGTTAQYPAAKIGLSAGAGIITTVERRMGRVWAWILTLDALIATWLAAMVLMNALTGITGLITGVESPFWGILYGVGIALFLVGREYHWFENLCKLLVAFVVACFFVTLFMADLEPAGLLQGLRPNIPGGVDSALMMAAIMGGAVHITVIGMHTYTTNARGWQPGDLGLARVDTLLSMGLAFGTYSTAIFLVAAAVLHPHQVVVQRATDAALALAPLSGPSAKHVFLFGLLGATFSTLLLTFMAGAFFVADKLHWPLTTRDRRFAPVVWIGCALSMLGPFIKGSFFVRLPIMLALGLTGTPLIIGIIIFLPNRPPFNAAAHNSWLSQIMGAATLGVTTFLALRFILTQAGQV